MTKHREPLQQVTRSHGIIGFGRMRDDPTDVPSEVRISEFLWREMGSPQTITLTVEPGDLLNVEKRGPGRPRKV